MGIGGAAAYSLALLAIRGLELLGALITRSLAQAGHWLVNGATLYGAKLYAPPDALCHPWNEMKDKEIPPRR